MLACCIAIFFLDKNDDYNSVRSTLFFHYSVNQTVAFLVTILTVFHFINEERKTFFFKREDMSEKVIEIKSVGK